MQLLELKKEFERGKHELSRYHQLLEKREHEFQKIHTLKEHIEVKMSKMHQLMKTDPQRAEEIKNKIIEETESIATLKTLIKHIDEELDQLGEEKEILFERLKQNLIAQIKNEIPNAAEEYDKLEAQLASAQKKKDLLTHEQTLIEPLFRLFQEGAQIKPKAGFFDFLFDKTPRALLARKVHHASTLAEKIYPIVKEKHARQFIEKFLLETKKEWNHELYRGKFAQLFEEFSQIMENWQMESLRLQNTIKAQESAIDAWIEKYSP